MAAMGGTLYVADLTVVRMFDAKTGKPKGEIKFPGATFINDVAADGGQLLVTDSGFKETKGTTGPSGSDAIYTVDYAGKILKTIKNDKTHKLNGPNGVAEGNFVVTFGAKQLLKYGKPFAELPYGMLDGIVGITTADNVARLAISSWECTCILVGKEKGPYTVLVKDIESPADIGWDAKRKHLLVPVLTENRVEIHQM
ncbi:MAG: hypothetical protein SFX73_08665 [Kofleriaceae bacterium]|nr:hypothetical protein [Kofleriaceae bacterium]